jgi:hypothetical protein
MKRLMLFAAALAVGGALAATAAATPPQHFDFSGTFTANDITGICPFPIDLTSEEIATGTNYYDASGNLVRVRIQFRRVLDTFSANGHTLNGLPYTANLQLDFENGQLTRISGSGGFEKVVLPDGTIWHTAGHTFNSVNVTTPIILLTDVGRSDDINAFCAALAP